MTVSIEDLRQRAQRRLPRTVFDYIEGFSDDGYTVTANRQSFDRYLFRSRALVDVSAIDHSTTLLGEPLATPIVLAPTGLAGLLAPRGEELAAKAAASRGTVFTLSTMSIGTIEEVAAAASTPLWFQLYIWKDRSVTQSLLDRAKAAGYRALCLTVDVPVMGNREQDRRNGFTVPPRIHFANVLDVLRHLGWVLRMSSSPRATFGNFVGHPALTRTDAVGVARFTNHQFDTSVTWKDVEWLRSHWPGPLVIKGITNPEDARRAVSLGVEALIVSNHGGRQLDFLPAAIDLLPEVVDAVEGRAEVILDGGIRRGSDIAKAIAMGARACMVGRPFLYGLAADGQAGVELALDLLTSELDRTLALLGRPRLSDLDRTALRVDAPASLEPRTSQRHGATPTSMRPVGGTHDT
ncbi:(S)-2-hydroxy-acid oxidase [Myxococcus stipitatus DSM 14675]|uniref:(S)-2-hydroxy-acid oxidase n=1 Tax=Myxococcus stipitatus (strain DSM 14675 / JCM 12634 / Mx s8) TaxID=1278073 RepID=L7U7D7_MYXSD|nr:alpha-hydroxy acid oxidase [Myxococcus stipitatus]AGC44003.1 (S)-2-hydroxy-acid oxidase [Myxococcus stipitatus DSM 14675]